MDSRVRSVDRHGGFPFIKALYRTGFRKPPHVSTIRYCCRIIGRHTAQAECGGMPLSALFVAAQEERAAECPGGGSRVALTLSYAGAPHPIFADENAAVRVPIQPLTSG